jgi:tubulin monoglycylase TTLL3/8
MFGYDFMVDTNYKVWLLEINSSPSMDYSTVIFYSNFSMLQLN